MRRPPPPHAQIHLPPLEASSALIIVDVFERSIAAIWRVHGDAMADLQAARGIDTPRPPDALWSATPADLPPDDCF